MRTGEIYVCRLSKWGASRGGGEQTFQKSNIFAFERRKITINVQFLTKSQVHRHVHLHVYVIDVTLDCWCPENLERIA